MNAPTTPRPEPHARSAYPYQRPITTRWMDNDVYAHVNNVVYYSWFDTVVNGWLIERGLLVPGRGPVVGLVVSTRCSYFAPVSFPERVTAGLRVERLGRSSVTYAVAVFREDEPAAAAQGEFVHAYVDHETRRPQPLPDAWRAALQALSAPIS